MTYKNFICLIIGIIIGVRLTDVWDYVKLQSFTTNPSTTIKLYNLTPTLTLTIATTTTSPSPSPSSSPSPSVAVTNTKTKTTTTTRNQNNSIDESQKILNENFEESILSRERPRQPVSLVDFLFNETRVLCWVMTSPANHLKRALHIKHTWGRRCNKLLFMSTKTDQFLGAVKLPVGEGRMNLWAKTRAAFRYVYKHHYNDADWFLKADDDTYVIMENLRAFLYQYSADAPVYFGCKFNRFVKQGYMSGGAGYVLSKEALRRFAEIGYANKSLCSRNTQEEDKEMGVCMENLGVIATDSRDVENQEQFLPIAPIHLMPIDTSKWFSKYLFYKRNKRLPCCSRSAISFHYTKPKDFYIFDYFLYKLRPFGVDDNTQSQLPPKANMSAMMEKWKRSQSNNIPDYT